MLELKGVSKSFGFGRKRKDLLIDVDLVLPGRRKIALLGQAGAGKTTVLRLMSALETPDNGVVRCSGLICWPLGHSAFLDKNATVQQNASFLAHIYGVNPREVADIAVGLSSVNVISSKTIRRYTALERRQIALGLTLALQFDWYFVDDFLPWTAPVKTDLVEEVIADRFSRASVVWATRDPKFVSAYCDAGLVLNRGGLTFYDTIEQASEAFLSKAQNEGSKRI